MLDAHYNGEISISDYWAVGDTRTETISDKDTELIIIGMNHDDKDDGSGKAVITVQTKDQFTTGYMDTSFRNYSLWSDCARRTWCNNDFKTTLPTWLQDLVKSVTKLSNRTTTHEYSAYATQVSTVDDVFILSSAEVFGGSDGTQYEYMTTQSNRIKNGSSSYWWTRSSFIDGSGRSFYTYVTLDGSGTNSNGRADYGYGIAPAFCL